MRILIETRVKDLFKGKCSIYRGAWKEIDNITYKMLEDLANRTEAIVKGQERKIATINDIQQAHSQYLASYEANLIDKITNQIKESIEKIRKGVTAYHNQTNLSDGTKQK